MKDTKNFFKTDLRYTLLELWNYNDYDKELPFLLCVGTQNLDKNNSHRLFTLPL